MSRRSFFDVWGPPSTAPTFLYLGGIQDAPKWPQDLQLGVNMPPQEPQLASTLDTSTPKIIEKSVVFEGFCYID